MNEIVEINGHFVGVHPVVAKELERLRIRVAELEARHPEWMKRIQQERQEERERCAKEAAGLMCRWLDEQFYHGNSGMFPTSALFLEAFNC